MRRAGVAIGVLAVAWLASSAPLPANAQDDPQDADRVEEAAAVVDADVGGPADADQTGAEAGDGAVGAGTDAEPVEASDARRLVRIRRVVALDKQRLSWLRGELRRRTQWFEELATAMEQVGAERNAKERELEALEKDSESDPEALRALQAELTELRQDFSLIETQTDLALAAEKNVREQVEALERKIAQEELALGRLTGDIPVETAEPGTPPERAPTPAATEPGGVPLPLPLPPAAAAPEPTAKRVQPSTAMTAAQLQATKNLQRREREVEIAKAELDDFIERKRALERQIELENELAQSDALELENLQTALATLEARLQTYRDEGASADKIKVRERGNRRIAVVIEETEREISARNEYLESLDKRLDHLEEAQLRITAEVDAAQDAVVEARRRVRWLESPLHPQNVAHWAKERGPRMLLVIVAAILLLVFVRLSARRIARTVVRRRRDGRGGGTGRADTVAFGFQSASRVLILVIAVLLVFQEAGVDIKTVLGGAAILGVAIAFGAQDLMKDYFSGFLILLEDQYQLGDLVTIGGITGTVESVNMRVTVLRDLEGRVHFVPNGNISHVTNRTYAWGRPVFEVPVGFDEDVDRVMEVLVDVAKKLANDPDWSGSIIGEPEMLGVDKLTDYGIVIKFMVKTRPDQLFPVRRQMLRRIVRRFQELGIRITVPQRMIVRDGPGGDEI